MKTNLKKEIPSIIIIAIPFLYLLYIWNTLPDKVPMHWNIHGEIDRYGSKTELLIIPFILPLVTYLLMLLIPNLDPKGQIEKMGNKYNNLRFYLVTFMSILAIYILYTSVNPEKMSTNIIFILIGGLYILLGNYFKVLKPNYFVGIKTPWTLESDEVWKSTHRLAGTLWMVGGLIIVAMSLVLSSKASFIILMAITAIISIYPVLYSYFKFKKIKKK